MNEDIPQVEGHFVHPKHLVNKQIQNILSGAIKIVLSTKSCGGVWDQHLREIGKAFKKWIFLNEKFIIPNKLILQRVPISKGSFQAPNLYFNPCLNVIYFLNTQIFHEYLIRKLLEINTRNITIISDSKTSLFLLMQSTTHELVTNN